MDKHTNWIIALIVMFCFLSINSIIIFSNLMYDRGLNEGTYEARYSLTDCWDGCIFAAKIEANITNDYSSATPLYMECADSCWFEYCKYEKELPLCKDLIKGVEVVNE